MRRKSCLSPGVLLLLAVVSFGCSAGGSAASLVVGSDGMGGASGGSGAGGSVLITGDAGLSKALSAHIEQGGVAVTFVTVSCSNRCADVQAVATGGYAPYTFTWEDGSTNAARTVCPTSTTSYQVSVTDTGTKSGEFPREPQTVTAPLTANVIACPDGGSVTTDGGSAITDSGSPATGVCLSNPSFEGTVTPNQFTAFQAPPWNACYAGGFITYSAIGDSTLWATQSWTFPSASDGRTYLALGQQGVFLGRASETLCDPIPAGASRSFLVDLAHATTGGGVEAASEVMQILGGSAECQESEVLWTSPELTSSWVTYCVSVTPTQQTTTLGFRPLASGGGGEMEGLVDHVVPVSACP